jgi:Zinc dependent phospholipase C
MPRLWGCRHPGSGLLSFGSRDFSNLVHYVRSGDFVRELLLESQDVNEYVFALGALSHYASDIAGHPGESGGRDRVSEAASKVR